MTTRRLPRSRRTEDQRGAWRGHRHSRRAGATGAGRPPRGKHQAMTVDDRPSAGTSSRHARPSADGGSRMTDPRPPEQRGRGDFTPHGLRRQLSRSAHAAVRRGWAAAADPRTPGPGPCPDRHVGGGRCPARPFRHRFSPPLTALDAGPCPPGVGGQWHLLDRQCRAGIRLMGTLPGAAVGKEAGPEQADRTAAAQAASRLEERARARGGGWRRPARLTTCATATWWIGLPSRSGPGRPTPTSLRAAPTRVEAGGRGSGQ
jgi:hypothetical protein